MWSHAKQRGALGLTAGGGSGLARSRPRPRSVPASHCFHRSETGGQSWGGRPGSVLWQRTRGCAGDRRSREPSLGVQNCPGEPFRRRSGVQQPPARCVLLWLDGHGGGSVREPRPRAGLCLVPADIWTAARATLSGGSRPLARHRDHTRVSFPGAACDVTGTACAEPAPRLRHRGVLRGEPSITKPTSKGRFQN